MSAGSTRTSIWPMNTAIRSGWASRRWWCSPPTTGLSIRAKVASSPMRPRWATRESTISCRAMSPRCTDAAPLMDVYDFSVKTSDGNEQTLAGFRDQVMLIVNVASKCGFTPQYSGLEALYRKLHDRGFSVLGFPCNQFGQQEPGSEEQIRRFCSLTYDVTFPLFAKIDVNGPRAHPLY